MIDTQGSSYQTFQTGFDLFDGLVGPISDDAVILLYGLPGGGKSSLTSQIVLQAQKKGRVAVFSLEESQSQWLAKINRYTSETSFPSLEVFDRSLGSWRTREYYKDEDQMQMCMSTGDIVKYIMEAQPRLVVIDSLSKVISRSSRSSDPGTVSQIQKSIFELTAACKAAHCVGVFISQVNSKGKIMGPTAAPHEVDVVVKIQKVGPSQRKLIAEKNRFKKESFKLCQLTNHGLVALQDKLTIDKGIGITYAGVRNKEGEVALKKITCCFTPSDGRKGAILANGMTTARIKLVKQLFLGVCGLGDTVDLRLTVNPGGGKVPEDALMFAAYMSLKASSENIDLSDNVYLADTIDARGGISFAPDPAMKEELENLYGINVVEGNLVGNLKNVFELKGKNAHQN